MYLADPNHKAWLIPNITDAENPCFAHTRVMCLCVRAGGMGMLGSLFTACTDHKHPPRNTGHLLTTDIVKMKMLLDSC